MASREILYCLVIFAATSGQCLVAVWAAASSRPWPLRALVASAAIVALIPIRAYVPALVFAMTAAQTAIIVAAIRHWHRSPGPVGEPAARRFQFRLSHLLILILFVAMVLALLRHLQVPRWQMLLFLPLLGVPLAPVIALAYHSVAGPARWKMAAGTLVAIFLSTALLLWWDLGQNLHIGLLIHPYPGGRNVLTQHLLTLSCIGATLGLTFWLAILLRRRPAQAWKRVTYMTALGAFASIGFLLACRYLAELWSNDMPFLRAYAPPAIAIFAAVAAIALVVILATAVHRALHAAPAGRWSRTLRATSLCIALLYAIPAVWLYWQMLWWPAFPPSPPSALNHYERLTAIAGQLVELDQGRNPRLQPVSPNPMVDEARTLLLSGSAHIPLWALEAEIQGGRERTLRYPGIHVLYGYLTLAQDQPGKPQGHDRSADYALAQICLDTMFHRGGTTGHARISHSHRAQQWLASHAHDVSMDKAREIILILERCIAERDNPELMLRRDRVYHQRTSGWTGRLKQVLSDQASPNKWQREQMNNVLDATLQLRRLQVLYAVRLFQHDHARVPAKLTELSPAYLPSIPLDPYSGRPLLYRPAEGTFELYSVGRDGVDDGGRYYPALYHQMTGFDLDLSQGR